MEVRNGKLPDDPQEIFALLKEGTCPCCGTGPFQRVGGHVKRKHGVTMNYLKDLIGLNREYGFCSEEVRARLSEIGKKTGYGVRPIPRKPKGHFPNEIAKKKLRKNRWDNAELNKRCAVLMQTPEAREKRIESFKKRTRKPTPAKVPSRLISRKGPCLIPGCDKPRIGRGLCNAHYKSERKKGGRHG